MKTTFMSLAIALATLISPTLYADVHVYKCASLTLDLHINDMNYDRDVFYELYGNLNGESIRIFDDEFKVISTSTGPAISEIMGVRQVPVIKCEYSRSFYGAGGAG